MEKNELKMLAGIFVKEIEIKGDAKLQLFKFVRSEASDNQLMSLILDGGIVSLSEQAQSVVEDRFKVFEKTHAENIKEVFQKATKDFLTSPLGPINRLFGQCAKKCGRIVISGKARDCKKECQHKRDMAIRAYKRRRASGQEKQANRAQRSKELAAA